MLGALTAVALALLVAGCTGDEQALPAVTAATPSVPVLQPGQPGQPNATLSGSAAAPVTTPSASPADARFYQDMIVHHAQALVMVRSVAPELTDPQVKGLALRIGDEQEPEIGAMAALARRARAVRAPRGHEPQPHRPRVALDAGHGHRGGPAAGWPPRPARRPTGSSSP